MPADQAHDDRALRRRDVEDGAVEGRAPDEADEVSPALERSRRLQPGAARHLPVNAVCIRPGPRMQDGPIVRDGAAAGREQKDGAERRETT
jgi:hypothetical protein